MYQEGANGTELIAILGLGQLTSDILQLVNSMEPDQLSVARYAASALRKLL